jgi:hypothetical protein
MTAHLCVQGLEGGDGLQVQLAFCYGALRRLYVGIALSGTDRDFEGIVLGVISTLSTSNIECKNSTHYLVALHLYVVAQKVATRKLMGHAAVHTDQMLEHQHSKLHFSEWQGLREEVDHG